ncbi:MULTISPECIES: helix-turn-helix domain-containing protein [Streptococcus]|uniref:helix-turn-helix domain-containing protein n=1 Tax=Streptococcus TaxID=1301 RepID=UPI001C0FC042|nr:helix-turn-helix transcriptional regulator [Streptococcus lutetiensis]MBU5319724.1 helix-turn-helix domain-containing protein [Streptococcus lutetiensis]
MVKQLNRLRKLRENEDISLAKLCVILKRKHNISVSPSQLMYYETGEREPRNKEIWEELAKHFNVSVSYLLGYSDKKEPYYDDEILLDNGSGGSVSLSEKRDSDIIQKYNEQLFNSFEKFLNDFNFVVSDSEIENFVKLLSYYNVNNMSHPLFLEALKRQNINQSKKFLKDNGYSKLGDNFQSTKAFDDFKKSLGYDTDHIL